MNQVKLILAYMVNYSIGGTIYLAIKFAIETIPTFLMLSARYLIAGFLIYTFMRVSGEPKPSSIEWFTEAKIGFLLLPKSLILSLVCK